MTTHTHVLVVVDNLITATRILEGAKSAGIPVEVVRSTRASERCIELRPLLVLIDLEASPDILSVVGQIRSQLSSARLVGFYPHVRTDLRDAALGAGLDQALPRSALQTRLTELLRSAAPRC